MASVTSTPFHLAHQGLNDLDMQLAIANAFTQLCPELIYVAPRLRHASRRATEEPVVSPSGSVRLSASSREQWVGDQRTRLDGISIDSSDHSRIYRIGFISCHFYDHSIGRILLELIGSIQRQSDIDVTVFLLDKYVNNGDHVADTKDQITELLEKLLETNEHDADISGNSRHRKRFVRLSGDIHSVRSVVGGTEYALDALVFADVGMELSSFVLSHSRLAPIQVVIELFV